MANVERLLHTFASHMDSYLDEAQPSQDKIDKDERVRNKMFILILIFINPNV